MEMEIEQLGALWVHKRERVTRDLSIFHHRQINYYRYPNYSWNPQIKTCTCSDMYALGFFSFLWSWMLFLILQSNVPKFSKNNWHHTRKWSGPESRNNGNSQCTLVPVLYNIIYCCSILTHWECPLFRYRLKMMKS